MEKEKQSEGVIFIGNKKPFVNYLTALTNELSKNPQKLVKVRARGNIIPKAIGIAMVVKERDKEIGIAEINLGIVRLDSKDREGKDIKKNVSTIEITLKKV